MERAKISVIIPVYNKEKFLEQCLNSVVKQTQDDIEIVIVDDGSTDNSPQIISKYKQKYNNIKVITQKNKGVIEARIEGYRNATGEYIGWIDADDFIEKDMYKRLYEEACKKNCDIAMCNYNFFPKEITHKKKWFKEYNGEIDYKFIQKNTIFWNKIVKKDLLDRINIEKLLYEIGEASYTFVLINTNKIVTVDENLYNYRVGHESFSTNYKNCEWFEENVYRAKRKRELLKNTKLEEKWKDFFDYAIFYYILLMLVVAINTNNKEIYKKYKAEIKKQNTSKSREMLKSDMGFLERLILLGIICNNYYISKPIVKLVLKMK